jgi:hypothetical protein
VRGRDKRVNHTHLLDDYSAVDVSDMASYSYLISY